MLRPATPLTILLLISFVLLLLSVISTPIVHKIPIATFEGVNFGVFGYCKGSSCSGVRVGYTTDGLFGGNNGNGDFNLPASTRHSLSSLLIVHPVAAFFNLVCLGLAGAAHLHSPSHSARYLLGLLILLLPTLLITLLAFLVDILLFVPHLQWGGWIVLASTILITASGVVTCAMRRTLVARKARKRRIAENAEMSGENYYARQDQEAKPPPIPPPLTAEAKQPMVNGAPGADQLPAFATFEARQRRSDDERRPLNSSVPPSSRLNSSVPPSSRTALASAEGGNDGYYGPPSRSRSQPPYKGPRDEYGRPLPPSDAFGAGSAPPLRQKSEERRAPSATREDAFGAQRGGFAQPRGRGGYPSRGSYGPRGGYAGPRVAQQQGYSGRGAYPTGTQRIPSDHARGGFPMAPVVEGAAAGMAAGAIMHGGQHQPPPEYPPYGDQPPGDQYGGRSGEGVAYQPQVSRPISQPYTRRVDPRFEPTSPSDYGNSPTEQHSTYGSRRQSPSREARTSPYGSRRQSPAGGVRHYSPAPPMPNMPQNMTAVGQAVEMDASTGRRNMSPVSFSRQQMSPTSFSPSNNQFRDSDVGMQGMAGPQHNRQGGEPGRTYGSGEEYIPPRAQWEDVHHATTIPDTTLNTSPAQSQPHQSSPVELATSHSNVGGPPFSPARRARSRVGSGGSDSYYEDVNPRFAAESNPVPPVPTIEHHHVPHQEQENLPQMLQGPPRQFGPSPNEMLRPASEALDNSSYEDLQQGARSPAESETSNFTSVSQRGVNPNWRPGFGGEVGSYGPTGGNPGGYGPPPSGAIGRKPVGPTAREQQMRRDMLLVNNSDFEIPGIGPNRRGNPPSRSGGGMMRGNPRMQMPMQMDRGGGMGMGMGGGLGGAHATDDGADGRYPPPGP